MKKTLLIAAVCFVAAATAHAQASTDATPAPAEAASSPAHMKAKHRKPMHVESTQPKPQKHHAKKAAAPAPQASGVQ